MYVTDSHGNQAWSYAGQLWYMDPESGNFDIPESQQYPPPPPPLEQLISAVPSLNKPIEGKKYLMYANGIQGYYRATYKDGNFYDDQVGILLSGALAGPPLGPGNVLLDPKSGVAVIKLGDYANTGISFPAYNFYNQNSGGGDSTYMGSPGVTIDLRTPDQLASDLYKAQQASAPSGFDKFMQSAVIGTLGAIATAGVAAALAPGANAADLAAQNAAEFGSPSDASLSGAATQTATENQIALQTTGATQATDALTVPSLSQLQTAGKAIVGVVGAEKTLKNFINPPKRIPLAVQPPSEHTGVVIPGAVAPQSATAPDSGIDLVLLALFAKVIL